MPAEAHPAVFVGSSVEGLPIAETVQINLDYHHCEVTLWSQGIFGLGEGTLESLVRALDEFDFAILVLTPDDLTQVRGKKVRSARDNVLLELGLCIGALGRKRTFAIYDRTADLNLPTDLAGVTHATFSPRRNGNLEGALGAACTKIKRSIEELGLREHRRLDRLGEATDQVERVRGDIVELTRLLARSRLVELDLVQSQFGGMIPSDHLDKIRQDLEALRDAIE